MFTQSLYVLTNRLISLDEVAQALVGARMIGRQNSPAGEHWSHGSESWVLATNHHDRGRILIDVVHRPFPEHPQEMEDRRLEVAWSMGQFGPSVVPGCLSRAQANLDDHNLARDIEGHAGFVRLRFAYAPATDEPAIPPDREPLGELQALSHYAYFITEFEETLALFDPNGEQISDVRMARQEIDVAKMMETVPLKLWMTRRSMRHGGFYGRRTIGVGQWYRGDLFVVGNDANIAAADLLLERFIKQSQSGADSESLMHEDGPMKLEWVADEHFPGSEIAILSLDSSSP